MENSNIFYDRLLRDQFNEEEQCDIVSKDPCFIMHMHDASIKVQEKAICKDPNAIRHIRDQSEYIKRFAIKQGCLLKYIEEPDIYMKYDAIDKNPINIKYSDYDSSILSETLLNLAIDRGALEIFNKLVKTNNCEKTRAVWLDLENRHSKNLQKEYRENKNCTIS
jgi:hypothetical protein